MQLAGMDATPLPAPPASRVRVGVLLLGTASILFAATTVFAKLANQGGVPGLQAAFARFVVGFVAASAVIVASKRSPHQSLADKLRPNNLNYTLLRAFFNVLASIFFFLSVEFTTITNANMLNQTSPVYIFLLAPFFAGYKGRKPGQFVFLLLTLVGIYLVMMPQFDTVNLGDIFGAISGILGGIAITMLHQARKYDSSGLILLYQMGLGTVICGWLMANVAVWPDNRIVLLWLTVTGVVGWLAQFLLTIGYKFIDAERGSLVSALQIPFAAVFGALVFGEPLGWRVLLGGGLILASLVGISGLVRLRKSMRR